MKFEIIATIFSVDWFSIQLCADDFVMTWIYGRPDDDSGRWLIRGANPPELFSLRSEYMAKRLASIANVIDYIS
jgi:hypothetical protein